MKSTHADMATWYTSPQEYLWAGVLGGCTCGGTDPVGKMEMAYRLLEYFGTPHKERAFDDFFTGEKSQTYELIAHWFYEKGITEHGGSVFGSWLTKYGEELLEAIGTKDQKDNGVKL